MSNHNITTPKKSMLDSVVNSVLVNHKRTPSENVYPTNPNIPLNRELSNPLSSSTSAMQNNPLPTSPLKHGISSPSLPSILHSTNHFSSSSPSSNSSSVNNSPSTSSSGGSTTSLSQHHNGSLSPNALLLGSGTTTVVPSSSSSLSPTCKTTATHDDDDEEEESSSEEEYEDDSSILSLQSMAIGLDQEDASVVCMSLSDLGDNIILRIAGHLHADDTCSLIRASKHFQGLLASNQLLWKELNSYYVRTLISDPYDVNLWDEELYQQQQQSALNASATVKEKSRSITFSSKDAKKSILDINATVGKKSTSKSDRSMIGSSTLTNVGNLVSLFPPSTSSNNNNNNNNNNNSQNSSNLISSNGTYIMVLNAAMRKLTPLTSVPTNDEISEFVSSCPSYPSVLVLKKIIQRYNVPREFTNGNSKITDLDWKRLVEIPIQLRVGKLLRRIVDSKAIEFKSSALFILMTFIRGYLNPQSEMAKGLILSIQKKLAFTKRPDITKLPENLLCKIFRNLDLHSVCQCLKVCQKWKSSINNANLWDHLYLHYRKKLCCENDINIWDEVNQLTYFTEITSKLTPPVTSPYLVGVSGISSHLQTLQQQLQPQPTAAININQQAGAGGSSPIFTNTLPPLPTKPPLLSLPKMSINGDQSPDHPVELPAIEVLTRPRALSMTISDPHNPMQIFSPLQLPSAPPQLQLPPLSPNSNVTSPPLLFSPTSNNQPPTSPSISPSSNNLFNTQNQNQNQINSNISTPNITSPQITSQTPSIPTSPAVVPTISPSTITTTPLSSSPSKTPDVLTNPQPPPPPPQPSRVNFMNLNQLVEKLTSITFIADISEVNACLATYRTFTTTPLLINKLLQRYHVPSPPSELHMSQVEWRRKVEYPIQHNVFKVLKKLIDEHFDDFDKDVVTVLKIFLKHIIVDNTSLSNFLLRSFVKKVLNTDIILEEKVNKNLSRPKSGMSSLRIMSVRGIKTGFITEVLTMPADDIAKQLTLIDFEIYSKIQTSEFLNQAWVKEKTRHLAPNLRAAIDRFNMITKWVCTVILKEEKIRTRAKYMSKILKVAKSLKSLQNYHTLMAILSGLNEPPIFRLKFTFAEMKQKVQKMSTELQALMTVEGNHDTYRSELASVDPRSPCIPYLGVFLKDITFFHEGGQDGGTGINLKQSKNVYGVLKVIRNFQKNHYDIEDNSKLRESLTNPQILSEDELYSLSLQREPRNCKRTDLI